MKKSISLILALVLLLTPLLAGGTLPAVQAKTSTSAPLPTDYSEKSVEELNGYAQAYVYFERADLADLNALKTAYDAKIEASEATAENKNYQRVTNAISKLATADFYDDFQGYTAENPVTDVWDNLYQGTATTAGTLSVVTGSDGKNYLSVSLQANTVDAWPKVQLFGLSSAFLNGRTVQSISGDFYNHRSVAGSGQSGRVSVIAAQAVADQNMYRLSTTQGGPIGDNYTNMTWYSSYNETELPFRTDGWADFTYTWNEKTSKYDFSLWNTLDPVGMFGSLTTTDNKPNGGLTLGMIGNDTGDFGLLREISVVFANSPEVVAIDAKVDAYTYFTSDDLADLKAIQAEYAPHAWKLTGHASYQRLIKAIEKLEAGVDFFDDFEGYTGDNAGRITENYVQHVASPGESIVAGVTDGALSATLSTTDSSIGNGQAAFLKLSSDITNGRNITKITAKFYSQNTNYGGTDLGTVLGAYYNRGGANNDTDETFWYLEPDFNRTRKLGNTLASDVFSFIDHSELNTDYDNPIWTDLTYAFDGEKYTITVKGTISGAEVTRTGTYRMNTVPSELFLFGLCHKNGTAKLLDDFEVTFDNAAEVGKIDAKVDAYTYFTGDDLADLKAIRAEYAPYAEELTNNASYARLNKAIEKLEAGVDFYDDFQGYTDEEGKRVTDVWANLYQGTATTAGTLSVATGSDGKNYLSVSLPGNQSGDIWKQVQLFGLSSAFLNGRTVQSISGDFYNHRSVANSGASGRVSMIAAQAVAGQKMSRLSTNQTGPIGDKYESVTWYSSYNETENPFKTDGWADFTYTWNEKTSKYDFSLWNTLDPVGMFGSLSTTDNKPNGGLTLGVIGNATGDFGLLREISIVFMPTVSEQIEDVVKTNVQLEAGASIRAMTRSGIRFTTNLTGGAAAIRSAIKALDSNISEVSFGTLVSPWGKDAAAAGFAFTHDGLEAFKAANTGTVKTALMDIETKVFADTYEMKYYAALVDLLQKNLAKEFTARAYVKVTYSDDTVEYFYGDFCENNMENNTRSIVYVAQACAAAGYPLAGGGTMNAEQKAIVDAYAGGELPGAAQE